MKLTLLWQWKLLVTNVTITAQALIPCFRGCVTQDWAKELAPTEHFQMILSSKQCVSTTFLSTHERYCICLLTTLHCIQWISFHLCVVLISVCAISMLVRSSPLLCLFSLRVHLLYLIYRSFDLLIYLSVYISLYRSLSLSLSCVHNDCMLTCVRRMALPFLLFLEQRMSYENMWFWLAVEKYRVSTLPFSFLWPMVE